MNVVAPANNSVEIELPRSDILKNFSIETLLANYAEKKYPLIRARQILPPNDLNLQGRGNLRFPHHVEHIKIVEEKF
jgi:hypothetical protein